MPEPRSVGQICTPSMMSERLSLLQLGFDAQGVCNTLNSPVTPFPLGKQAYFIYNIYMSSLVSF